YTHETQNALLSDARRRLEALPGVEKAGAALVRVLTGDEWDNTISVIGYEATEGENMNVHFNAVTPGYFPAVGVPILEGRDIAETDVDGASEAAVVNQSFARYFFKDESALGRRFKMGGPESDN